MKILVKDDRFSFKVEDIKKMAELVKELQSPPTLANTDNRELRESCKAVRFFEKYSEHDKEVVINYLIKAHNTCSNSFRQVAYQQELHMLGVKYILEPSNEYDGVYRRLDKIRRIK